MNLLHRRGRKKKLTQQQQLDITNQKRLQDESHLSLQQRCIKIQQQYGLQSLDPRMLRRYYQKNGIRFRSPNYYYQKKFSNEQEICSQQQDFVRDIGKRMQQGENIYYVDETSFHLWQLPRKLWMKKRIQFPMQNNRYASITMIGAINQDRGLVHYSLFTGSNNTATFTKFIKGLLAKIRQTPAVVVMDNLIIHKTQKVKDTFKEHKGIDQMFIAPYSSTLNPIERLWSVLKRKWKSSLVEHCMEKLTTEEAEKLIRQIIMTVDSSQAKIPKRSKLSFSQLSSFPSQISRSSWRCITVPQHWTTGLYLKSLEDQVIISLMDRKRRSNPHQVIAIL